MANDVLAANNAAVVAEPTTPNYNRKVGEAVLALTIKCKPMKTEDGKEFNSVSVLKYLPAYDKEGNFHGKCHRWISLHFTKDAFKGVPNECDVHTPDDLMTGILYVKAKAVQSPREYKIIYDEVDKEWIYPEAWIKLPNCIVGFEPYVSGQDEFDYHPSYDAETGEITEPKASKNVTWEEE